MQIYIIIIKHKRTGKASSPGRRLPNPEGVTLLQSASGRNSMRLKPRVNPAIFQNSQLKLTAINP